jgi:hypothetical protein
MSFNICRGTHGSLAMFTAMRNASSRDSRFIDICRCGSSSAPCSWMPEESQVESSEHQDYANIHCQPFPELVSEEREIYTEYDGCHRHPRKARQLPVCPFQLNP